MCWCREQSGRGCDEFAAFQVELGLLTANGLYSTDESCILGEPCTSTSRGVGIRDGDAMMLKVPPQDSSDGKLNADICSGSTRALNSNNSGISSPAYNNGRIYEFGIFNMSASPGAFAKCWCRPMGQDNCSEIAQFKAESGLLNLHCPAGYFSVGSNCKSCTTGYYCLGIGTTKQACPRGRTTLSMGARRSEDCLCMQGYELEVRNHLYCFRG